MSIDYTLACTRHPRCYLADGHPEHCLAPDGTVLLIRRAATPPASAERDAVVARRIARWFNEHGHSVRLADNGTFYQDLDALFLDALRVQ